ncbi:hypothetical protein [Curtobacterium sp. BH-2-1-1]|uniref:hypothetical protein n=1 Tax=Curtobacterium sp. BH-2-1-1 TaxID=1905847 RepID=UPI0012EA6C2C|nr:hypothetical protein [Curtobacterium sp. BH-2-1-1]
MALYFDPFRELDRLTATMFDGRSGPRFVPMDLSRHGDHSVLNADMPGVDPGSMRAEPRRIPITGSTAPERSPSPPERTTPVRPDLVAATADTTVDRDPEEHP